MLKSNKHQISFNGKQYLIVLEKHNPTYHQILEMKQLVEKTKYMFLLKKNETYVVVDEAIDAEFEDIK